MTYRLNVRLHRFAIMLSCMTVALLVAGALVTSNEAGDSVPDWPLSFGRWLIGSNNFVANVRYEYSHRFVAGIVGVTTLLFAVCVYFVERRGWMRSLGLLALGGVIAQAAIGGLRVLLPEYKALIAIPHALVAQSFFAVIVSMTVFTSRSWFEPHEHRPEGGGVSLRQLSSIALGAVLLQLVLGAGFRHGAIGIAPHIAGAVVVTSLIGVTAALVIRRHRPERYLTRPAKLALGLLVIQLGLGIAAYLARLASANDPQPLEPMISLTVAHLVVGALTLATLVVLALRCHQVVAPRKHEIPESVRAFRSSARGAAA